MEYPLHPEAKKLLKSLRKHYVEDGLVVGLQLNRAFFVNTVNNPLYDAIKVTPNPDKLKAYDIAIAECKARKLIGV